MKRVIVASAIALAGCAANSGVAPMGNDTYMVSRQAATGFTGMGTLKADALREANQYCVAKHQSFRMIQATESAPPYILGNYPKVEVEFTCSNGGESPH